MVGERMKEQMNGRNRPKLVRVLSAPDNCQQLDTGTRKLRENSMTRVMLEPDLDGFQENDCQARS